MEKIGITHLNEQVKDNKVVISFYDNNLNGSGEFQFFSKGELKYEVDFTFQVENVEFNTDGALYGFNVDIDSAFVYDSNTEESTLDFPEYLLEGLNDSLYSVLDSDLQYKLDSQDF